MKKVQHEKVNVMQYLNSATSNSVTLKATTLKSVFISVERMIIAIRYYL